jgi:hypothetical protein
MELWDSVSVQDRFWQRRFYDFNVFSEAKRTEKLRYMHRNHRGPQQAPGLRLLG